jgi:inhibitor of cysteine peptidase
MGCPGPRGVVRLDADDNGRAIEVNLSTQIIVTLASNITTGYQWTLAELDTSIVENTSQEYIAPDSSLAGAPGTERWEFIALGTGTTALRLEYRRPWEGDEIEPTETFQVELRVNPAAP